MKKLFINTMILSSLFLLTSCNTNSQQSTEIAVKEVWETVKAHNKAWSELEDINEQLTYVHNKVVFIKPPFKVIINGIENYKKDYENWMLHAKVNYFHEVDPEIKIYGDGNFAIVTYNIDMAFTYDDEVVDDWKGADMMTLVKENGRWLIVSDMYGRDTKQVLQANRDL